VSLELYFLIRILDKRGYDPFTLWLPLNTHSVFNAFFVTNLSPNAKKVVGGGRSQRDPQGDLHPIW
jgi:hypothetical protein